MLTVLLGLMQTSDDIAGGQPVFWRQDSLHIILEYEKKALKNN